MTELEQLNAEIDRLKAYENMCEDVERLCRDTIEPILRFKMCESETDVLLSFAKKVLKTIGKEI